MSFPYCETRGVLDDTPNGPRVNLNRLHSSFTRQERAAWYSATFRAVIDEYGIPPEEVELFLGRLANLSSSS